MLAEPVPFEGVEERQQRKQRNSPPVPPIERESLEPDWLVGKPREFNKPLPHPLIPATDVEDPFRLTMPGQPRSPEPPQSPAKSTPETNDKARRLAALHSAIKPIQPVQETTANPTSDQLWIAPEALPAITGAGTHALDEVIPAPVPRPHVDRTPLTTILSAFLEEKNIRWGELIGGLLIICCSIALVISFWAQINERPLFKFSLFNGVTAAIFAIGFYTQRRWKIRTTSLGLLLIGALLTPLNFLAIAAYTDAMPPTDLLGLGGEAVSLALFFDAGVLCRAGTDARLCVFHDDRLDAACLWQLLTRRFIAESSSSAQIYFFAGVPLASYLLGMAVPLDRWRHAAFWNERRANRMFRLWLILTASTALPLALLLYKTGTPQSTLQMLSPLLVIAGLPSLAIGLLSAKKILAPSLLKLRITGMSLGLLGGAR